MRPRTGAPCGPGVLLALAVCAVCPSVVYGQAGGFDPFAGGTGGETPRTRPAGGEGGVAATAPRGRLEDRGPTISQVRFDNQDINLVFQVISDASGWSIFPASKVKGSVSLFAKDITAGDVLDEVVRMAGLVHVRVGNIVNVMTFEEYTVYYGVIKKTVKLQNRSADELAGVLLPFLTSRGKLMPDAGTGTLVIYEAPENLPKLLEVIRAIDQPADHRIVEVIRLIYADAGELSEHLQEVYGDISREQGGGGVTLKSMAGGARPGGAAAPVASRPAGSGADLILSAERTVAIHAIPRTNHIVLRGYREDLKVIKDLIGSLDVPSEAVTKTYQIKHLTAEELVVSLQEAVSIRFGEETGYGGGGRQSGIAARQRGRGGGTYGGRGELTGRIAVSVVAENNSVVVTAPEVVQAMVVDFLDVADRPPPEVAGGIKSYRLENAAAADVAKIIQELVAQEQRAAQTGEFQLGGERNLITGPSDTVPPAAGGPTGATPPGPAPSTPLPPGETAGGLVGVARERMVEAPRVTFSQATNSVIIQASIQQHAQFAELIKELDRRLDQVLLEVVVVELRGNEDIDVGVELESFQRTGDSAGHLIFTSFGLATVDPATGRRTTSVLPGGNAAVIRVDEMPVLLTALQGTGKARLRSAPRLLVNDNSQGRILSIAEEPFSQVNASTTVATTSFGGFVQAGTQLVVTPHLSNSDFLRLEYEITLNSFRGPSAEPTLPPARDTTTVSSQATIPDGDTLIIGGLTSNTKRDTVSGVPLLADLPGIGALFRRSTVAEDDVRIYIFVSPTILRDAQFRDLRGISENQRHESRESASYPVNSPLELE